MPQLYNILIGNMSSIGPRPLLPRDQSPKIRGAAFGAARVTGWAQVNGGRVISATDKAFLDIWYVRKASLLLDAKIIVKTITMLCCGDCINWGAVHQARTDFEEGPRRSSPRPRATKINPATFERGRRSQLAA